MATKNKYETNVKPRFDEIKNWLERGTTEKDIADRLEVSLGTFSYYKKKYPEFSEFIKQGRKKPVDDIKSAMLKRAVGFKYEDKKEIIEEIIYNDGTIAVPAKKIKTEITTKNSLPDVAAGLVLLQHWAKDEGWSRDPQALKLKKEELKLKKKHMEDSKW